MGFIFFIISVVFLFLDTSLDAKSITCALLCIALVIEEQLAKNKKEAEAKEVAVEVEQEEEEEEEEEK